jgi:hypothetical protein
MQIELTLDGSALLLEGARDRDTAFVIGPEKGQQIQDLGLYVVFGPGTTGGAVTIETAPERGFAGTWAVLERVAWKTPNRVHYVGVPGARLALRVRIDDPIRGGTVRVYGVGRT